MKRFKEYNPDQQLVFLPVLDDWLEEGHLAYFIRDVVGELDLSAIYADYRSRRGGRPAYDPQMMVSLLLYGYCVGIASSRKIERATYEQVPFRVLAADQHPDHDTICTFQGRHLEAQARQQQGEADDKGEARPPEATGGPAPEPDDRAQRNFTDPDSRMQQLTIKRKW